MPKGYVQTALGQVHYRREGEGPPILLLGASGRSSRMYQPLILLLAPNFDVIAPDTPGFGNSDPLTTGTGIEQLAAAFIELLDALGCPKADVYGLHTGNKVATAMAVRWPDRIGRLVLAGQSHSLIPDQRVRNATIRDIVRDHIDPLSGHAADLVDWSSAWKRLTAIWWEKRLVSGGANAASREAARRLALDELQSEGTSALYEANFAYDLACGLRQIRAPVMVLEITTPEEDRTIGRQGLAVRALISHAVIETLQEPDGHTLTLENRAQDLAIILRQWLHR